MSKEAGAEEVNQQQVHSEPVAAVAQGNLSEAGNVLLGAIKGMNPHDLAFIKKELCSPEAVDNTETNAAANTNAAAEGTAATADAGDANTNAAAVVPGEVPSASETQPAPAVVTGEVPGAGETPPAPKQGGRRRSKHRHGKKGGKKSKKAARSSKKGGRSRKNGSKNRRKHSHKRR